MIKKWVLFIYMGIAFIGVLLYRRGMGRLASDLSRISSNIRDFSEKSSFFDSLLSGVKDTFSLPHIGLLKYLYTYDLVIFVILYSLIALLVFWFAYKAFCDWTRLGEFALAIAIILSASVYQFTLALIGLYVYLLFFFQEDLRHFSRSSLRTVAATLFLLFAFWVMYGLNNPNAFVAASFSDTFFGFPNFYRYFARWYVEGFPVLSIIALIGLLYMFREYIHDSRETSYTFFLLALPLLILFPAFFHSPWYGSRYTFHIYPMLIIIFSFVIVKFGSYVAKRLTNQFLEARWPDNLKKVAASGTVVLLAGWLSQDISPAELLAMSSRTYQSTKDPIKSSINWTPYADFHQDYLTPAIYVKGRLDFGDTILVQATSHVAAIYYHYLKKVDYVLLPKWILEVGIDYEKKGRHYLTGSQIVSGVRELRSVLRDLKPCHKLWIMTDVHMKDGQFYDEDVNSVFKDYHWTKVFTGKDGKTFVYVIKSC